MGNEDRDPLPIGKVLDDQTHRLGMGGARQVGALFSSWERIVGPAVAAHVEPASLRKGVLKLRADSPTWATEIGYLRDEIRDKANEALGSEVVSRIEIGTGPRKPDGPRSDGSARGGPDPSGKGPSDASERSSTDDPMTAFERARQAWLRRRAKRF